MNNCNAMNKIYTKSTTSQWSRTNDNVSLVNDSSKPIVSLCTVYTGNKSCDMFSQLKKGEFFRNIFNRITVLN